MSSDSLRINTNKYPNFLGRQSKALMFKLYRIFPFSNHIPNEKLSPILFHAIVESPANDFKNIVERTEPSPPIRKLHKENSAGSSCVRGLPVWEEVSLWSGL